MATEIPEAAKCPDHLDVMILSTTRAYRPSIARLAAEEKGLKWRDYTIDILYRMDQYEPWYIELNPGAYVPTLLYNVKNEEGEIIERNKPVAESLEMIKFMDSNFKGKCELMKDVTGNKEMEERFELFSEIHEDFDVESYSYGLMFTKFWLFRYFFVDMMVYWKTSKLVWLRDEKYKGDEKWKEYIDKKIKHNLDYFFPIIADSKRQHNIGREGASKLFNLAE